MACSAVLLAKRSLVALLLRLATAYQVVVSINRDSPDVKVTQAFRKVVLKVHPDKGGSVADAQKPHRQGLTVKPPTVGLQTLRRWRGLAPSNSAGPQVVLS